MDIYEFYKTIETREDFKEFLKLLQEDYKNNGSEWENDSLELFLEALYGYN
ncbi:MAG: hypothetical protein AAGI25_19265 [Bacteroidota bacterium]